MPATARSARARSPRRIGVFGGTFDPPHLGHLALAERARARLRLDLVLFVPARVPPHKRGRRLSSARTRVAMTRLTIRGRPGLRLSTLELARRGPSFTVETLRALHTRHPGARLYLLLGADSLEDFGAWHAPDEIARLATLVVAVRPGHRRRRGRGVRWLDNPPLAVSSSAVRARARRGGELDGLVPDAVARYIARHRLYRSAR
jgi:nicotinate-nucleotide adenylyltransferase